MVKTYLRTELSTFHQAEFSNFQLGTKLILHFSKFTLELEYEPDINTIDRVVVQSDYHDSMELKIPLAISHQKSIFP